MPTFSRRNKYNIEYIQTECASDILRRRIIAAFYKKEFNTYDTINWTEYTTGIEDMMIEMGVPYEFPRNEIIKKKNAEALQAYMLDPVREWYVIFDFIERYLHKCDDTKYSEMSKVFNDILEDEVSAYRIIDEMVVPIINDAELVTISSAMNSEYETASKHIYKALELFANRDKPDYENSIKESISAVESICASITGTTGPSATLGRTIKKLKDAGIHIHPSMENAFSSLYGYTSDESGIRHGSIDFAGAPAEDARFMLITCSAFVNYLIEKRSKLQ